MGSSSRKSAISSRPRPAEGDVSLWPSLVWKSVRRRPRPAAIVTAASRARGAGVDVGTESCPSFTASLHTPQRHVDAIPAPHRRFRAYPGVAERIRRALPQLLVRSYPATMRQGFRDRTGRADASPLRDLLTRFKGMVDAMGDAQTRLRLRLGRVLTLWIVASICAETCLFRSANDSSPSGVLTSGSTKAWASKTGLSCPAPPSKPYWVSSLAAWMASRSWEA